jgi:hypothetical protein
MCTKILLEQIEKMKWDGGNSLIGDEFTMSFATKPMTKGLEIELQLKKPGFKKTLITILHQDQHTKLIREMVKLWASQYSRNSNKWVDDRIDEDTRIGPNIQQFINTAFAHWVDADTIVKERAMDSLRKLIRMAQKAGLTREDVQTAWDEGLFDQILQS